MKLRQETHCRCLIKSWLENRSFVSMMLAVQCGNVVGPHLIQERSIRFRIVPNLPVTPDEIIGFQTGENDPGSFAKISGVDWSELSKMPEMETDRILLKSPNGFFV